MDLLKKIDYSDKVTEIESEIVSINGLSTAFALTAVENEIPGDRNLVEKKNYVAKILDIEFKYFTTADYNKFTIQTLDANIKQKELLDKNAFSGFINNDDLDKNVAALATKAKSKAEQD